MIKIFHTGDVHLDSPFAKMESAERLAARKYQRELFLKLSRYVAENKYDLVLISGDLLDSRNVSPEAEECALRGLSEMGCPVVISPGNHDPYLVTPFYRKRKLPDNVFLVTSREVQVLEFGELGLQVCGYAFTDSNILEEDPLEGFTPPEFDGVTLLCAHGELDTHGSRFAPIRSADLSRCGFLYSALGHIHIPSIVRNDSGVVAYSGVPDCRGYDEEGFGGAVSVVIDGGEVISAERVIFGEHRYVSEELDVSALSEESELTAAVLSHIAEKGYDKKTALRLTLTGESSLELGFSIKEAERAASERLMLCEIESRVLPKTDIALLKKDFTLRGEIYRTLESEIESGDPEVKRLALEALRAALLAADGREIK